MSEIALIYVTFPDEKTARSIGETLLQLKIIACFNFFEVQSMYRWENEITREGEVTAIIKTRQSLVTEVKEKISSLHPYKIPCMLVSSWEANVSYFLWVVQETERPA